MSSSGMLGHSALVTIDVLEEHIAYIIRVKRISERGRVLAATINLSNFLPRRFSHPDDVSDKFLRNVGYYKCHAT
jgi:hypothetical protein